MPRELRPALDRDERIVAWARARGEERAGESRSAGRAGRAGRAGPDSAAVVATNLGVFLPDRKVALGLERAGSGPVGGRPRRAARLGWHEIHKATWTGHELILVPAEVVEQRAAYLVTADGPAVRVAVTDPAELPDEVRARVTRSVSYSSHERLPDGGGVRVVARRIPGVDGLTWAVRYDAGTDPGAPGVAEATADLVRARSALQSPVLS